MSQDCCQPIHVRLALYDSSRPSLDGSFWSWRAPELTLGLLDQFYYEVVAPTLPQDSSRLRIDAIVGGIAQITPDWACVFRLGNGGRDAHGRPGRFVLLVAAVRSEEAADVNLAQLAVSDLFNRILSSATVCDPVPAPEDLEPQLHLPVANQDCDLVNRLLRERRIRLTGSNVLAQTGDLCASLSADLMWACRFWIGPDVAQAAIELQNSPGALPGSNTDRMSASTMASESKAPDQPAGTHSRIGRRSIAAVALLGVGMTIMLIHNRQHRPSETVMPAPKPRIMELPTTQPHGLRIWSAKPTTIP